MSTVAAVLGIAAYIGILILGIQIQSLYVRVKRLENTIKLMQSSTYGKNRQ